MSFKYFIPRSFSQDEKKILVNIEGSEFLLVRNKNGEFAYSSLKQRNIRDTKIPSRNSQEGRILHLLLKKRHNTVEGWVKLPEILNLKPRIACYKTCMTTLRAMGHTVENQTTTVKGVCHSKYRLK